MREKLYLKTDRFSILSLFYDYYLFFDTSQYLADRLFIRNKVRVWYDLEYAKDGSPYQAIFCRIRKKDASGFLAALEELKNSMIIHGHVNYEAEVAKYLDAIENTSESGGYGLPWKWRENC